GVTEGVHRSVLVDDPIALPRGARDDLLGWVRSRGCSHRAEEPGVPETEDAAIRSHHPVPGAIRGGTHAHDRPGEPDRSRRAVEPGVAEREYSAVGGHQPVAGAIG